MGRESLAAGLLRMGVDPLRLERQILTAAEFVLDQMETLEPYDHHAACDLALKRARQIVDLAGQVDVISLTAEPKPLGKMVINMQRGRLYNERENDG